MPPVGPGLPLLSPPREELHSLAGRGNLVPADVKLAADLDMPPNHNGKDVFAGVGPGFDAKRRPALVVLDEGSPADLDVSVRAEDSQIMGLRHRRNPVERVPFHPESLLTTQGKALLKNFLALPRPA